MATARETILAGPFGNLNGVHGILHVQRLFKNFCDYAKRFYTYRATRDKTVMPEDLLSDPDGTVRVVDCYLLRQAFLITVWNDLGVGHDVASVVNVNSLFATRLHSKCFDANIHGNVRAATGDFAGISRCVFNTHYFTKVGTSCYDPCMLAIYATEAGAKSWTFQDAKGDYFRILYKIKEDDSKLLIRIPLEATQPYGFGSSFLQIETKELDKAIYHKAFDTWTKPGWQLHTKSINQLLQAAGIMATWPKIK